jgi:hypothetical protein
MSIRTLTHLIKRVKSFNSNFLISYYVGIKFANNIKIVCLLLSQNTLPCGRYWQKYIEKKTFLARLISFTVWPASCFLCCTHDEIWFNVGVMFLRAFPSDTQSVSLNVGDKTTFYFIKQIHSTITSIYLFL